MSYVMYSLQHNSLDVESLTTTAKLIAQIAAKSKSASVVLGEMGAVKQLIGIFELDHEHDPDTDCHVKSAALSALYAVC